MLMPARLHPGQVPATSNVDERELHNIMRHHRQGLMMINGLYEMIYIDLLLCQAQFHWARNGSRVLPRPIPDALYEYWVVVVGHGHDSIDLLLECPVFILELGAISFQFFVFRH